MPRVPALFMYSRVDAVIAAKDVEAFAAQLSTRYDAESAADAPPTVRMVDFETSRHVSHLFTFRKRYTEELNSMLERCGVIHAE